jgi:hypothetical protein
MKVLHKPGSICNTLNKLKSAEDTYVEPNNGLKRLKCAGHIIIPKDVLIIYFRKFLILGMDKTQQYKIQCNKIHTLIIPLPPAPVNKHSSSLTSSV